jgi:hypothetical protein
VDISGKQLELLKVFLPTLSRIAVLLNPGNAANPAVLKHVQAVAPALSIVAVNAGTPQAIENAFADAARQAPALSSSPLMHFSQGKGRGLLPRRSSTGWQQSVSTKTML